MLRAASFIYKPTKVNATILAHLGYATRKLWNVANYEKRNWRKEGGTPFPNWYHQKRQLKNHFWYKNLPSQTAQEVLNVLQQSWDSFFELKRTGGVENPKPPRFKQRNFNIKFLNNGFKIIDRQLRCAISKQQKNYLQEEYSINEKFLFVPLPKNVELTKVKTIEFIPLLDGSYKVVLVQEYADSPVHAPSEKFMAIDLGISNAFTCYDFQGHSSIFSGRQWLSVERYFHKQIAHYQAISDAQQHAKGVQYAKKSKRVLQLYKKKRQQSFHLLHCMTKKVVELALTQGVETIVMGDLTNIRKGNNLGKVTNQKLHALPFKKLTDMIRYKAEQVGISVVLMTEEYTSQTCAVCQPMPAQSYAKKSNRKHRGLYVCQDCHATMNADVNGAINISKKYLKGLNAQSVVVLDTPILYTFNGQQFVA